MSNRDTLETYNNNIEKYIEGTPHEVSGDVAQWIDASLEGLANEARILEIGSGFGRDADYIESKGYTVKRTDGSIGFVEYLQSRGCDAELLNVLEDDLIGEYDLIFADAVFLHFTADEFSDALAKCTSHLVDGDVLSLSLKKGSGEEVSTAKLEADRYFKYWSKDELYIILKDAGYDVEITEGESTKHSNQGWIRLIARKGKR